MPYAQAWPQDRQLSPTSWWSKSAGLFTVTSGAPPLTILTRANTGALTFSDQGRDVFSITFTPFDVKISDGVTMTDAARSFIKAVCEVAREGDAAACAGVKP